MGYVRHLKPNKPIRVTLCLPVIRGFTLVLVVARAAPIDIEAVMTTAENAYALTNAHAGNCGATANGDQHILETPVNVKLKANVRDSAVFTPNMRPFILHQKLVALRSRHHNFVTERSSMMNKSKNLSFDSVLPGFRPVLRGLQIHRTDRKAAAQLTQFFEMHAKHFVVGSL